MEVVEVTLALERHQALNIDSRLKSLNIKKHMKINKINLFLIIFISVILLAIVILSIRFLSGPEDTWLYQNGQWIKHGNPSFDAPQVECK